MFSSKKIIALLLALILVVSPLLSCSQETPVNPGDSTADVTTESPSASKPDVTTTASESEDNKPDGNETKTISFSTGNRDKLNYAIVRPDGLDSDDADVLAAFYIRDNFEQLFGENSVSLKNDFIKDGETHNSETLEILVGNTSYDETAKVAEKCGYGDYIIEVVGNKIVIFAYLDDALEFASRQFVYLIAKNDVKTENGYKVELTESDINMEGSYINQISEIPKFEGGTFSAYYDSGLRTYSTDTRCDVVIIDDATAELYSEYLKKLESEGFEKYKETDLSGNKFAIYENEEYTLTAGFYAHEETVRILMEPTIPRLPEKTEYKKVTTSQITMLGTEFKQNTSVKSNGLAIIIRLEDGRFIVVDGGYDNEKMVDTFLTTLKSQSAAYTDKPVIAAWIITHAHGDHHWIFNKCYNQIKQRGIVVENVMMNMMSDAERAKAHEKYPDNITDVEGDPTNNFEAARKLNAVVHKVHVGQEYYFADVKIDVLFTLESRAPTTANALNASSTVMRMTFVNDGKTTTYLSPGDATGAAMRLCVEMYGNDLKSDIVQVCHHGYSTWGDDDGMALAYRYINAPLVLWPQGLSAFANYRNKKYNKPLFETPMFKECYVSGGEGDITIVPLPYVIGETVVITECTHGCTQPHKYTK